MMKKTDNIKNEILDELDPRLKLKIILVMLLVLAIIFCILVLSLGTYTVKHRGFDSPEDAANAYMDAFVSQDQNKLRNCIFPATPYHQQYIESTINTAKNILQNTDIVYDKTTTFTEDYHNDIDVQNLVSNKDLIHDIKDTYAIISIKRTLNNMPYKWTCRIRMIMIKNINKWYVIQADISPLIAVSNIDERDYDVEWQGNDTFGYLLIPKSWSRQQYEHENNNAEYTYVLSSQDQQAMIMTALYPEGSNEDEIIKTLSDNINAVAEEECSVTKEENNEYKYTLITAVCKNDDKPLTYIAYVIESSDEKIRTIELISTPESLTSALLYINSFTLISPETINEE